MLKNIPKSRVKSMKNKEEIWKKVKEKLWRFNV